jgi:hypothetical protein
MDICEDRQFESLTTGFAGRTPAFSWAARFAMRLSRAKTHTTHAKPGSRASLMSGAPPYREGRTQRAARRMLIAPGNSAQDNTRQHCRASGAGLPI